MNLEEEKAIALLKQLDNFDDLCETCYYIDTERKTKYGCWGCREEAKDIVLNLIEKLKKENAKLKNKLLDILECQKVIKEETLQYIKKNYIQKNKIEEILSETEITDFNSLVEAFLEIKKLLESE